MRRISLALALIGAVAATGCGKSATSNNGGNRGVAEGTFTVLVQNGQNGNTSLAITGGYVTSVPAGIDCGVAPHGTCSFEFPENTTVTITATATSGNSFWGYAGDCYTAGNVCTISGKNTEKYVLARFGVGVPPNGHPNWEPGADAGAAHSAQALTLLSTIPESATFPWQCAGCHGSALTGSGMAPSCANCHAPAAPVSPQVYATGENCRQCHAGQGAVHQATYNKYADASLLVSTIDAVVTTPNTGADAGTFKTDVTFTVKLNGAAFDINTANQKRYSGTKYDPATKTFDTATSMSFGTAAATGTAGQYKVTAAKAKFDILAAGTNAFLYFYFGDKLLMPKNGNYNLMDNVASVAKVYGTIDYVSAANVSACENCHGAPYMKHGYRAAKVAGLPDMVACKACHHDARVGTDFDWQVLRNEPATLAALSNNGTTSVDWTKQPALATAQKYPYVANTMNDTHMSHSMEFAYPQSMASCVTCHAGKFGQIFADTKFTGIVCKSCHATTAGAPDQEKRAPLLAPAYHNINWITGKLIEAGPPVTEVDCFTCHSDNAVVTAPDTNTNDDGQGPIMFGQQVPLFKDLHNGGLNPQIYAAGGARYNTTITTTIGTVTKSGNTLTVPFSVAGANASALIKPTVVVSLYGFDTKDFLVSGHGSQPAPDGKRNLEYAEGSTSNSPRLAVVPATTPAGTTTWTATVDLTLWAAKIGVSVKQAQISVIPTLGVDQTLPTGTTNLPIAMAGATKTFDLVGGTEVTGYYGSAIVDPAKCNKCHDALGTTFHNPNYGSAGVITCRLCHVPANGGSHLEQQSRSIDSYVHAIHSMQEFDPATINWSDPVQVMEYNHHVESTYPNFTTLSCESCHNPGTYEASPNDKALPAVLSASASIGDRTISGLPATVVGPAAKACGGCHRAELINEDEAAEINAFEDHTKAFGYGVVPVAPETTTTVWNQLVKDIFGSN